MVADHRDRGGILRLLVWEPAALSHRTHRSHRAQYWRLRNMMRYRPPAVARGRHARRRSIGGWGDLLAARVGAAAGQIARRRGRGDGKATRYILAGDLADCQISSGLVGACQEEQFGRIPEQEGAG